MFDFFAFLAIIILGILLLDTRGRLKRAEKTLAEAARRIGALQRHAGVEMAERRPPVADFTADRDILKSPSTGVSEHIAPVARPDRAAAASATAVAMVHDGPPSIPSEETAAEPPPPRTDSPQGKEPAAPVNLSARFEDLFGKTLPIWAGGITLAIAGVLIVRYAIDLGFFARVFTPGVQVVAGVLFGFGLIGGADYAWRNEDRVRDVRVPQALSGAGIATLYAAIVVAANVYGLIGPLFAFVLLALITAGALALSLRFGSPSALLGLAGGLAAPALVGALEPDIPLLAIYLALTIAAMTGVARMRRWPWLAVAALVGGAGWSLWIIFIGGAFDAVGSLSIGAYVLLLGVALPLFAYEGPRAVLLRAVAAIVGALQLALLVAYAGFSPLHWGLFALLAAAGQWLAWREHRLGIVPTTSLALSVLLMALWPDPSPVWLAAIGAALVLIHAAPLLARLWDAPPHLRRTLELCLLTLAPAPIVKWQMWSVGDGALALVALGAALLPAIGIARGWRVEGRASDSRFVWLTGTAAALIALALGLFLPFWLAPVAIAAIAAALLVFGKVAADRRIEWVGTAFLATALLALVATPRAFDELPRLASGAGAIAAEAVLRWAALALVGLVFALRAERAVVRRLGQAVAAALAYGAAAQMLPATLLVFVPAVGVAALLLAARRIAFDRLDVGAGVFAAIGLGWAALPVAIWSSKGVLSLGGVPMLIDDPALAVGELLRRLAIPALLAGVPLWLVRDRLSRWPLLGGLGVAGALGLIALHMLYRLGFAAVAGGDFVTTGVAQRLVWDALLIGAAWLLWRRDLRIGALALAVAGTAHAVLYSLVLHNPLWSEQAVGGLPLLNLLAPLFLLPWLGAWLIARLSGPWVEHADRVLQIVTMLLVALFAWASLRHLFHGSLLVEPGVAPAENILRSLLILLLAIGFLLWGIRAQRRDWRIASLVLMLAAAGKVFLFDASGLEGLLRIGSFVALGFSLIGIGWLYSRQLAPPASVPSDPDS
ncbi:DUF2339 domain-containing protein [Sphingopyxis sp. H115]|uniref:DUF2339 domain-containing protein n=1 Tax=Sphingopyxis sp. H115 TaxID=1759073 RepID=UPI0007366F0E|nr:DUF2339 domain-containing protein [Sphingopyxis sp. H115]KTE16587.1 hypothetical protein ATE71_05380 [Sphingopyxis sp. H115]